MQGLEIPLTADLSGIQQGFQAVLDAVAKLGAKIDSAMRQTSASMNSAGAASANTASKFREQAQVAGNLGNAVVGVDVLLKGLTRTSRAMAAAPVATQLIGWTNAAGGVRAAFSSIPAAMKKLWDNPTYKKIIIGAAAAVTAIVAIRGAWKTAAAGTRLLLSAAHTAFRGIIAGARATGSSLAAILRAPGRIIGSIPGLPIAGFLGAAGAVALLVTQLKGASEDAAVFENLALTVDHFTGSTESASEMLERLQKFSIKTPFETDTIQQTAAGLLGAGVRDDVAGLTEQLAALAGNDQQLRELGDAMGKGFAKGKFQTEELNKFLERGINLLPALQKETGLAGDEFRQAIEKGLGFETVTAAIASMSAAGGQMFGLLEKRSTTFAGLVSTLKSAWTDLRKAFAGPINDALKPILQAGIDTLVALLSKAKAMGQEVGIAIREAFEIFKSGQSVEVLKAGLAFAAAAAADILMRGVRSAVAFLAASLPPIVSAAFAKITDPQFWDGLGYFFAGVGDSISSVIRSAMPDARLQEDDINAQQLRGKVLMRAGRLNMEGAGNVDLQAVIEKALADGVAAATRAATGPQSNALAAAAANLQSLLSSVRGKVLAEMSAEEIFRNIFRDREGKFIAPKSGEEGLAEKVTRSAGPAVMSLTRIGGGGFASTVMNNLVSEAKKQTKLLTKLVDQGEKSPAATYA